ncbi:hypothetical protein BamMEX5DRAFT_5413 [Burkholderia ambifaria MEX-5]|uniref:Uncharacterized protein n=1 Tax=Burkholderia ambifaria MEX-5 TaxID=396597 RepID=B1TC97_9BURK|nr:hypothetical protein BamMEX5DRAFT_5413 [Burkholderia ambifaria MEX-5]
MPFGKQSLYVLDHRCPPAEHRRTVVPRPIVQHPHLDVVRVEPCPVVEHHVHAQRIVGGLGVTARRGTRDHVLEPMNDPRQYDLRRQDLVRTTAVSLDHIEAFYSETKRDIGIGGEMRCVAQQFVGTTQHHRHAFGMSGKIASYKHGGQCADLLSQRRKGCPFRNEAIPKIRAQAYGDQPRERVSQPPLQSCTMLPIPVRTREVAFPKHDTGQQIAQEVTGVATLPSRGIPLRAGCTNHALQQRLTIRDDLPAGLARARQVNAAEHHVRRRRLAIGGHAIEHPFDQVGQRVHECRKRLRQHRKTATTIHIGFVAKQTAYAIGKTRCQQVQFRPDRGLRPPRRVGRHCHSPYLRTPRLPERCKIVGEAGKPVYFRDDQPDGKSGSELGLHLLETCPQYTALGRAYVKVRMRQRGDIDRQ